MAGVSEQKAEALDRRGVGFARHLGVKPGSSRFDEIRYGTKRAGGWKPSREVAASERSRPSLKAAARRQHLSSKRPGQGD